MKQSGDREFLRTAPVGRRIDVKKLTTAALLVALDVVFTRFLSYMTPGNLDRLSFQFVAHAVAGFLLGPFWGIAAAFTGDVLGMLINSGGISFYPLFTLSACMRGLLYGLLLYKKEPTLWRSVVACLVVTLIVDLGMNPVWMSILYGQVYQAILWTKIPIRAVWAPVSGVILYFVLRIVKKVT